MFLRKGTALLWWSYYLLIADLADFEQNFLNAWRSHEIQKESPENEETEEAGFWILISYFKRSERASKASTRRRTSEVSAHTSNGDGSDQPVARNDVWLFVENEQVKVPLLLGGVDDSHLFKELRMFYRYMQVRRGLVELVIPRKLTRMDCVMVRK